jgi:serine/threonine-protein kinase RsbT
VRSDCARQIVFRLSLREESDIAAARRDTRTLAYRHGFPANLVEAFATAVSEVARNAIVHANGGEILLGTLKDLERIGVVAIVRDQGPGISNIEDAMRDGHTTGNGLGLGLPSARRLVDEFELESALGDGTTITLKTWIRCGA